MHFSVKTIAAMRRNFLCRPEDLVGGQTYLRVNVNSDVVYVMTFVTFGRPKLNKADWYGFEHRVRYLSSHSLYNHGLTTRSVRDTLGYKNTSGCFRYTSVVDAFLTSLSESGQQGRKGTVTLLHLLRTAKAKYVAIHHVNGFVFGLLRKDASYSCIEHVSSAYGCAPVHWMFDTPVSASIAFEHFKRTLKMEGYLQVSRLTEANVWQTYAPQPIFDFPLGESK